QTAQTTGNAEPTIEATPVKQGENNFMIVSGDTATFNINAPGAKSVRILYRPIDAGDRVVALKKSPVATANANGQFSTQVTIGPDFGGEVWGEVAYTDGSKKKTKAISLSSEAAAPIAEAIAKDAAHGDESERSDKFTGGKIETAALVENQPDIKI